MQICLTLRPWWQEDQKYKCTTINLQSRSLEGGIECSGKDELCTDGEFRTKERFG